MFLVLGITGKSAARRQDLSTHEKKVRALVRNREKASNWANQGVELVDGDWNDSQPSSGRSKTSKARLSLPAVLAPSPDFKEAKRVIANYVEALTRAAPPRVVALSSMGANRTSGLGMITALSLLEQGFRALSEQRQVVCVGRSTGRPKRRLGCEGAPLGQRGGAPLFVDLAGDEMALLIEMVVDLGMN